MTISSGFTAAEIREFVHEYQLQRHGTKALWLAEHGITARRMDRWRSVVFEGDLDRGLVPREGSPMTIPPAKRTALEKERCRERAAHAAEVERLTARVRELEAANDALGKAIGLLHKVNEHEPAGTPTRTDRSGSLRWRTTSSPS